MPKDRHQNGWLTIENGKYYGHYNLYVTDPVTGREIRKQPMFVIGPVSKMRKWEAEDLMRKKVEAKVGPLQHQHLDPATTFGWFVENRYVPIKTGRWRPLRKKLTSMTLSIISRHSLVIVPLVISLNTTSKYS